MTYKDYFNEFGQLREPARSSRDKLAVVVCIAALVACLVTGVLR